MPPPVVWLSCSFKVLYDFPNLLKIRVLLLPVMHDHEIIYNQSIFNIIFILLHIDFLSIAEATEGTAGTVCSG